MSNSLLPTKSLLTPSKHSASPWTAQDDATELFPFDNTADSESDGSIPTTFLQPQFTTTFSGAHSGATNHGAPVNPSSSTATVSADSDPTVTISTPGSGLVFVNTFSGADDEYMLCAENAERELEDHFITNETINVTFVGADLGYSDTGTFTGAQNSPTGGTVKVTYAQLQAALLAHDETPLGISLPSTDPNTDVPAGGANWTLPEAYARMLGLSSKTPSTDVTVTLNDDDKIGWSYSGDVTNVLLHELTENGMGRIGGFGVKRWSTMDLFTYSSPGVHDYTDGQDGQKTYFSYNGTDLSSSAGLYFHQNYDTSGDLLDTADSADFDVEGDIFGIEQVGSNYSVSSTDLLTMDALGWIPWQQDTYEFGGTGNFSNAADWTYWYGPSGSLPTSEDAYIADSSNVVQCSVNFTVNSIALTGGAQLTIAHNSLFTATNGTVPNYSDVGAVETGIFGLIDVIMGSTLQVGSSLTIYGKVLIGGFAIGASGPGAMYLEADEILYGGGLLELGQVVSGHPIATEGDISGYGLINNDDTIVGAGTVRLDSFINDAAGKVEANQSQLLYNNILQIFATNFSNAGHMYVGADANLRFGDNLDLQRTGVLTNTGTIVLGDDGVNSGLTGAQLSISNNFTIASDTSGGEIQIVGAGAKITSDFGATNFPLPATFTNGANHAIWAYASAQIGDSGLDGTVNNLTFDNHGSVFASGSGVTLTLNTGSNTIDDSGGFVAGENLGTLVIDSPLVTGQSYRPSNPTPPGGGTIEVDGGTVQIAAAVTAGPPPTTGYQQTPGQVVAVEGAIDIEAGGSVAVPITIDGGFGIFPNGVVNQLKGGSISGSVTLNGTGATLSLDANPSTVNATGHGGVVMLTSSKVSIGGGGANIVDFEAGAGNAATLSGTNGKWDTVNGSGGAVTLDGAQASIVGGGDTVTLDASGADIASLWSTNGAFDTVNGSHGSLILNKAKVSVVGGGDTVALDASGADTASLWKTNGVLDTVTGANGDVIFNSAQASVVGGNDRLTLDASGADQASLWNTGGKWDSVTGSNGQIILNSAQATVVGGGDKITLDASGADQASLWTTGANQDTVTGSNASLIFNSARASVVGGNDRITLDASGADQASLWSTGGHWDTVTSANETIVLNHAQASIVGGGNRISYDSDASDVASLYSTNGVADTVNVVGGNVTLNSAQANIDGYNDYISMYGASSVKETLTNHAGSFAYVYHAQMGISTITGFTADDTLRLSHGDFASLQSLFANNVSHVGGDTIVKLDPVDQIKLVGVTSLSQAQVTLV